MIELILDRVKIDISSVKVEIISSPANQDYFEQFEKNEIKLKEELNEYNLAYRSASQIYVR